MRGGIRCGFLLAASIALGVDEGGFGLLTGAAVGGATVGAIGADAAAGAGWAVDAFGLFVNSAARTAPSAIASNNRWSWKAERGRR